MCQHFMPVLMFLRHYDLIQVQDCQVLVFVEVSVQAVIVGDHFLFPLVNFAVADEIILTGT